jgi:glycosyltransferase EpsF
MSEKIKILHVVDGLGVGGAETWLLEMVKRNQGEVQFDFLLTGGVERELDKEFKKFGCNLYYINFSWNRMFQFMRSFKKLVRNQGYSVIHDHQDFVAGWHWLFLLFQLPPIRICHAHNGMVFINNYTNSISRKLFYKAGKYLNALLATHLTGTSNQLMEQLGYNKRIFKKKRIDPLYCGVAPETFKFNSDIRSSTRQKLGFGSEDKVIIFIGRIGLSRENEINTKNPGFAFSIASQLSAEDPSYKFLFVGEKGKLGVEMETEAKKRGLGNNIFFTGKRTDVHELLLAADMMLFTGIIESFGLIFIEAQFASLPTVASDIITREAIVFPEIVKLLNIHNADKNEWEKTIRDFFNSRFPREQFAKKHEKEINNSIYTIDSSYRRLLKTYKA